MSTSPEGLPELNQYEDTYNCGKCILYFLGEAAFIITLKKNQIKKLQKILAYFPVKCQTYYKA